MLKCNIEGSKLLKSKSNKEKKSNEKFPVFKELLAGVCRDLVAVTKFGGILIK